MRFIRKFFFLAAVMTVFTSVYRSVSADKTEFLNTLQQLKENGSIPVSEGQITSYASFSDSYTNMGTAKYYTITEADHFVLSSKISWLSAFSAPNGAVSGCGFIFGAGSDANNYLMTSIRMNGYIYFNGLNNGNRLSYGQQYVTTPSMQGEGLLTLIVDGSSVSIYFNGNLVSNRNDVVIPGNGIGFSILSGTNKDFGTQCTFEDIFLYTWQGEIQ